METLLELKTESAFDIEMFERMKKRAFDLLENRKKSPYTQAVVLFSAKGAEFSTVIPNALSTSRLEEIALLKKLRAENHTTIHYILCMWGDACIDLPSLAFRNMLCAADAKNAEAGIFVTTSKGVSVMKVANTLK